MTVQDIENFLLSKHPYLFKNPVGSGVVGRISQIKPGRFIVEGQRIKFGLHPGSADFVGFEESTGRFMSVEIKTEHDRLSAEQRKWNKIVRANGGKAEVWWYDGTELKILTGEAIE